MTSYGPIRLPNGDWTNGDPTPDLPPRIVEGMVGGM
jgi:hypothetical protein